MGCLKPTTAAIFSLPFWAYSLDPQFGGRPILKHESCTQVVRKYIKFKNCVKLCLKLFFFSDKNKETTSKGIIFLLKTTDMEPGFESSLTIRGPLTLTTDVRLLNIRKTEKEELSPCPCNFPRILPLAKSINLRHKEAMRENP